MSFTYVAIEREYGSGGTEIARRLARECGIACYGQEILEAVSKELNVSVEEIQKCEESVTNSFLLTLYAIGQMQSGNGNLLSDEGRLFVAEQEFIRKSACNGPAVYLGHCASVALKDLKVLKVFIRCSDKEIKTQRIIREYGITANAAESTRKRYDTKRAKYYYSNTAKKWEDSNNYDIVLDSAALGTEGCVDALKGLVCRVVQN